MKSRGVVIFGSVLAALQFLAAATALADIIGKTPFAIFVIAVGAVQVGWAFFQQNTVTPAADVGAYLNAQGRMVAGSAAGVTTGKEVEVVKTEPPASEGNSDVLRQYRQDEQGVMSPLYSIIVVAVVVVVIVLLLRFFLM